MNTWHADFDQSDTLMHCDIAIIGAGTVGMVAGIELASRGYQVVILDNKPMPTAKSFADRLAVRDARVYALSQGSIRLLAEIGVWSDIVRRADYQTMQVWARDDYGELLFDGSQSHEILGSMVEPSVLDAALWQRSHHCSNLTVVYEAKLMEDGMAFDESSDGITIRYHSQGVARQVFCRLLLGADGRKSMVRRAMGADISQLNYHQKAICCAIRTDLPHRQIARQVMLPTGTLALLPMADLQQGDDGRWQSIVWTLPCALADDYLADYHRDPQTLQRRLAFASGYALGEVHEIESVASFDLSAQVTEHYARGRMALIGDAAHGVHPLAGQGLNLGLSDVAALLAVLDAAKGKQMHPRLLHKYARAVRSHNALMMHSFSMINFAYASGIADLGMVRYARSEVVHAIARSAPLMQLLIKQANR